MAVHIHHHHFNPPQLLLFSLLAQNLPFHKSFPPQTSSTLPMDCLLGLRPLFGLIMLIGLFYFLIIIQACADLRNFRLAFPYSVNCCKHSAAIIIGDYLHITLTTR